MSDIPSQPPSSFYEEIYAKVLPENITDLNWIMEGYKHLALFGIMDSCAGIVKLATKRETYFETLDVLENMPFDVEILESFANEW